LAGLYFGLFSSTKFGTTSFLFTPISAFLLGGYVLASLEDVVQKT
jgi:hypothetical protein